MASIDTDTTMTTTTTPVSATAKYDTAISELRYWVPRLLAATIFVEDGTVTMPEGHILADSCEGYNDHVDYLVVIFQLPAAIARWGATREYDIHDMDQGGCILWDLESLTNTIQHMIFEMYMQIPALEPLVEARFTRVTRAFLEPTILTTLVEQTTRVFQLILQLQAASPVYCTPSPSSSTVLSPITFFALLYLSKVECYDPAILELGSHSSLTATSLAELEADYDEVFMEGEAYGVFSSADFGSIGQLEACWEYNDNTFYNVVQSVGDMPIDAIGIIPTTHPKRFVYTPQSTHTTCEIVWDCPPFERPMYTGRLHVLGCFELMLTSLLALQLP